MKIIRIVAVVLLGVLVAGLAAPYVEVGAFRDRIQNALERALDRKVKVGKVHFNILTGPGFSVEDVTIEDHPSIGIEPVAYVESLDARVELISLFSRRLSFSNLRLNNPTVNLSKAESGVWNFQLLGRTAPAAAPGNGASFPSIQVRSGRINFKFGDYKTIFYLSDSDVDVAPLSADRLDIRFSGQPARTDQAAQPFGRLLARGIWKRSASGPGELSVNAELERSSIPDLVRLVEGHGVGLHGSVASQARISGPLTNLQVRGQLRLEDVHRWDLLPAESGGGWDLSYTGTADLQSQRIEIQTERRPEIPFLVRFRASDYLSEPKFAASVEIKEAPLSSFLDAARHVGVTLPADLTADGSVAGVVGFSRPGGMQGQFAVQDSHVKFQKIGGLKLTSAEFVIRGDRVEIRPSTVDMGEGQTAEVEGVYDGADGTFDLGISTRGMDVAELHTGSGKLFGANGIPLIDMCRQGILRGSLHYSHGTSSPWTGQFELQNARLLVDGIDGPVRLNSAQVQLEGSRITIRNARGRAGAVAFRGDYIGDPAKRPDRLILDIDEADLSDIEAALTPSLRREAGLLARFRLRNPAVPEWLRTRRLSANVTIGKLKAGDRVWAVDHLRAVWEGTSVKLLGLAAREEQAEVSGEMTVDLSAATPRYRAAGKIENFSFRGGNLALDGAFETRGFGAALLANAQASGSFAGEGLEFPPETEFQAVSGNFELFPGGRVRLTAVQAAQGLDTYSGQGSSQPDGRILLELTSGKRQVRVAVAK